MKSLFAAILFILCFLSSNLSAQFSRSFVSTDLLSDTLSLSVTDTSYHLKKEFVLQGSEIVILDSNVHLERGQDYEVDYRYGKIKIISGRIFKLLSDNMIHRISVKYRALPLNYKDEYTLRKIEIRKDTSGKKNQFIVQPSAGLFSDDLFGPGLQKSGSIVRGFSIGSNRDLSLSSGFRMQMAGRLSQDIEITAALTDENSPIQPEGTTQTLREVDKVFIEIKHPNYSATLGDFNLNVGRNEGGEFGRINRKLQGGQGIVSFGQSAGMSTGTSVSFTGAAARGKYATNEFRGIEGSQGPYRLSGPNGENHLVIIAGSERVYLNGELMTRGEINDYVIDYASGEVSFSSRRLITNASRITVDFEYSDQQYARNLISSGVNGSFLGDKIKLNMMFIQEADDPDSPINIDLDDNKKNILRNSGADRYKASLSGIDNVGRDSITGFGKGQYSVIRDTSINGRSYNILVYMPGDTSAIYSPVFSPVDRVPEDSAGYDRVAVGQYRFAGIGKGGYIPVRFIPMPQLHHVFDVNGQILLTSDLTISGEFAASRFNQNRFSDPALTTLSGNAFNLTAKYNPKRIVVGGKNLGEVDLHISDRFTDRRFVSMDRSNEVEFNRKWDITAITGTANEEIREFSFSYRPLKSIEAGIIYGSLDRPGEINSKRTQVNIGFADSIYPAVKYQVENIQTSNQESNNRSHWTRQRGTAEYEMAAWQQALRIESEERIASASDADSMYQGSFRLLEIAPRIATPEFFNMKISAELQVRSEDSSAAGNLSRALNSVTQLYSWQLNDRQSLSSSLTLSIRAVKFTDEFKQHGNLNNDALLIRSQTRYTPFQHGIETDLYYEFSNQNSARLERIFVRVVKGTGNYKYLGDVNSNGIMDENDFELTRFDGDYVVVYVPSDQLYPVADIKASVRLRLQPARVITAPSSLFSKILYAVSTETYLRVDEKSKEKDAKQIYLLNLSRFQNSQTTITGSQQVIQDVFLYENDRDLSFRFRYNARYGLSQFVSGLERSYTEERSVRIRSQLVKEIGNQTDIIGKKDRLTASIQNPREHDLVSSSVISDFSYRPLIEWEIGLKIGLTETISRNSSKDATAGMNEEGIRIVRSFPGTGQLRMEFNREEEILRNITDPPYEMTGGRVPGKTYLWQTAFDYRITGNIQLSVQYNGRKEGGGEPVHYARMEVQAFF